MITATNRPYLPRVDYAPDDLTSVRDRLLARLPEALPGWNPRLAEHGGDYAALIAELFAHMAAILHAYEDHRANEGFLRTATLTRSLIDLARLIDYRLGAGASASALQAFLAKEERSGQLPAGIKLNAQPPKAGDPTLVFETSAPLDVDPSRNRMRVVGWDKSSRVLLLEASATEPRDAAALLDARYSGLKAGVPVVLDDGGAPLALPPAAITVVDGATRIAWARSPAGADRELRIRDLAILGRPEQTARLAAAVRADEVTIGQSVLPVENAAMFTPGGAVLVDAGGLQVPATVLAATVVRSPAGTITLNRGLPASIRRSASRVLEGTSCGYFTGTIRAGATQLERTTLSKKKDFPHTPAPGDLLLIVDASGVEMATVAKAEGTTITLASPVPRALRPAAHAFDPSPSIRYFMVAPHDPATHQTPLSHVRLDELSDVYVGGDTVLLLDKSVDAFAAGGTVALGDGLTFTAHRIRRTESIDSRTRVTLVGSAPGELRVALTVVYGAFEHTMRVAGWNRSEATLPAGTTQLDIVGAPAGLAAGRDLVIVDLTWAEGARVTQVQSLTDRTRVSLAAPLDFSYALADTVIYGNVAEVTHGAGAPEEVLGSGDPALAPQRFELRRSPLSWVADPAAPRGVRPAVEVFVSDQRWTLVPTLADSGPLDLHYAIEIDDRDRAAILLGDGVNGAAPQSGRNNIVARYRVGRGESANVAARKIDSMPQPAAFLDRTFNPAPASGGEDPETSARAKRQAVLHARTLDRAVSLADYADLALAFAGISKARADAGREGKGARARRVVVVTCAATGGTALSTPLKEALLAFLRARSPEPDRVRVRDHRRWPVRLALEVRVRSDWRDAAVQRALLDALGAGEGGFFSFERRGLGDDLALSSVYAVAEATPGVDHVLARLFHVETEPAGVADRIEVPADALATGGDATDGSVGRLSLHLSGGLP